MWLPIQWAGSRTFGVAVLIPLVAFTTFLLAPKVAPAVLIAEDVFLTDDTPTGAEYAVGTLNAQNHTNLGFTGAWSTSTAPSASIIATSLDYPHTIEAGGSVLSPTGNSRVHRSLASSNPFQTGDTETVYLAFLLQTGSNGGYRAFEMHNGGTDDTLNRKFQIGYSTFGDFPNTTQYGFRINNNPSFDYTLGPVDDDVHLFLAKFEMSTVNNGDVITVWNNPDITGNLSIDPAGGVTASGFNFAVDRLGAGHFTGSRYGFDELRIGTTLADVVDVFLYCDFNDSGTCNSTDFQTLSDNMFQSGTFEDGDANEDGFIDFADYRLFKDHPARVVGFDGTGAGAEAEIPEPGSALLLGIAFLCTLGVVTRRLRMHHAGVCLTSFALAGAVVCLPESSRAAEQDLLNDSLDFSGKTLNLRPYVTLPGGFNDIISMTTRPGDTRLYVTTQEGTIFAINDDGNGNTTPAEWFDLSSAVVTATGRTVFGADGHDGLQSVAFHPDFEDDEAPGYGKLYTTFMENAPGSPAGHHYLGSTSGSGPESVLVEWTYDHNTGEVDPLSYRELFRAKLPVQDHKIKQARFNPYAEPEDEDYGLLYLTHGDASSQQSTEDRPQLPDNIFGKMLRINPLESGPDPYSIPTSNPFYGDSDPDVLQEIYAYGMRNPHNFSFNQDDQGNVHILVGDIGRSNMEEVNLIVNGGNYGWTEREGTFVHEQTTVNVGDPDNPPPNADAGYILGVTDLPANEVNVGVDAQGNRYIYPVAQWDHNDDDVWIGQDYTATAIASGFVIRNGSDPVLDNQFIHHNFAFNHGDVYHNDFTEIVNAVTQLDPGDENRDEPSELTQSTTYRMHLTLDNDNNPNTPALTGDDINTLLGTFRNDGRYGEGLQGEMYISTKSNVVYLVTNTLPALRLVVDRSTGDMTLVNLTRGDIEIDSIAIESPSGSLAPGQFQTLGGGWTLGPGNDPNDLSQDTAGSLVLTNAITGVLGDAYDAQLVEFGTPAGEDLMFEYTLEGGGTATGWVQYVGKSPVPHTVVLTVDVASGEAAMLNQTQFAQEVEGYTILSPNDSLNPANWDSLDAQGIDAGGGLDWEATSSVLPEGTRLTEVTEDGTTTFDDAVSFRLGAIFETGGEGDLEFQFLLDGEEAPRDGLVEYILAGDYNDDGKVSAADFTVWRDHFGSSEGLPNDLTPDDVSMEDLEMLLANYGAAWLGGSGSGTSASSAAVPEPASLALLCGVAIPWIARRAKRRACR